MQKVVQNEKVARNTRSCQKVAKQFVESFNYNGRHRLFLSRGKENSNTPLFLQRKFSKTGAEPTACLFHLKRGQYCGKNEGSLLLHVFFFNVFPFPCDFCLFLRVSAFTLDAMFCSTNPTIVRTRCSSRLLR